MESQISKDDFLDWINNPVTQAVMYGIQERIQEAKGTLAGTAGINPLEDRYICGMIRAFGEVLTIEVDDVIKENS